jgi:hypothetical protein
VLSWAATADARAAAAAPDEQQAVGDLPPGWRTQPEMCWDAGVRVCAVGLLWCM